MRTSSAVGEPRLQTSPDWETAEEAVDDETVAACVVAAAVTGDGSDGTYCTSRRGR